MNSLTGFNTADQIIAALNNTSGFQSYKPGFNTIKINSSKSNILDITNIENSHVGFNVLIPPPEINYSVAIVGGIDNSEYTGAKYTGAKHKYIRHTNNWRIERYS